MNIIVCVKAVPDMEAHFKIKSNGLGVDDENLVYKMNSFDECAVEEALKIKEKNGGEVVIVSLGSEKTAQVMRKAFAMGADRGILLNDPAFQDSDSVTTAKLLKKAIEGNSFDLVLTGVQAEDDSQAQVGPALAELLNISHATVVTKLELSSDRKKATVHRELEGGSLEVVELNVPCLLTIQTGINIPRYPSLPGIMKAKKKEIKEIKLSDTGFDSNEVGKNASRVKRLSLFHEEQKAYAEILQGDSAQVASQLIAKLKERKVFN